MKKSCSHCEQFIVGQPQSCNHPSLKKESLGQNVNFHHQTSTMQFPPSFNLQSAQKSTPQTNRNLRKDDSSQGYFSMPGTSNNATTILKTTNTPLQTVVSIESNVDQNQSANNIETVM